MFVAMNDGKVKGMLCIGQNPATSLNAKLERAAMRKLEWLVVKDNWLHRDGHLLEDRAGGRERRGQARRTSRPKCSSSRRRRSPKPRAASPTPSGCCSGTSRRPRPPGDCRTDVWFTYQLGKRLKKLYADSHSPRDQGFKNLLWDFEHDDPRSERETGRAGRRQAPEGDQRLLHRRSRRSTCAGFGELKDDGSTTCASWIYSGVFPAPGQEPRGAASSPIRPGSPARS